MIRVAFDILVCGCSTPKMVNRSARASTTPEECLHSIHAGSVILNAANAPSVKKTYFPQHADSKRGRGGCPTVKIAFEGGVSMHVLVSIGR